MAFPSFNFTPASVLSNLNYGINLLTGSLRIDVVGIFDGASLQQVFRDARPMKASIRESLKVMEYPVETGVTLSDHKINQPKIIEISFIISAASYASTYQQITAAAINATLLTVQTRAGVYPNMIIEAYPHEEAPDKYDVIMMTIRFREVLFVAPASIAQPNAPVGYAPANPVDQNTIRRGQQSIASIVAIPSAALAYLRTFSAWGR